MLFLTMRILMRFAETRRGVDPNRCHKTHRAAAKFLGQAFRLARMSASQAFPFMVHQTESTFSDRMHNAGTQ
jgi:hypothetical protein